MSMIVKHLAYWSVVSWLQWSLKLKNPYESFYFILWGWLLHSFVHHAFLLKYKTIDVLRNTLFQASSKYENILIPNGKTILGLTTCTFNSPFLLYETLSGITFSFSFRMITWFCSLIWFKLQNSFKLQFCSLI